MQNAGTVAAKNLAHLSESSGQQEALDTEKAILVWHTLAEIFGSSFVSQHGESPTPIWKAKIDELTRDEIATGFKRLGELAQQKVDRGEPVFPPDLYSFQAACRYIPPVRFLGVEDKNDYKLIRQQRSTPEKAASEIEKIRANLRGSS
jgi:hypothetical protein